MPDVEETLRLVALRAERSVIATCENTMGNTLQKIINRITAAMWENQRADEENQGCRQHLKISLGPLSQNSVWRNLDIQLTDFDI